MNTKPYCIPPQFTSKFDPLMMEKFCEIPSWRQFYRQVIENPGYSIFIFGNPGSGKSQKMRYLLKYFAPFETIIYWDTGKEDLKLLFSLGKPIRFLIPAECKIRIVGTTDVMVETIPIFVPEQVFDEIKPGWINIISLRNFFLVEKNLKNYVRRMLNNFLLKLRLGSHDDWLPATMAIDEAHVILGNLRIDRSTEGVATGQDVANTLKECRFKGLRWLIVSQGYYDLVGTARENIQCYVICRGGMVDKRDNSRLKYLSEFAQSCTEKEGWIVLPNGDYYGKNGPIPFPYIPPVDVHIIYQGFVDERMKEQEEEPVIGPGDYLDRGMGDPVDPVVPSRYEIQEMIRDES